MILHVGFSHTLSYIAREQLVGLRAAGFNIHLACPVDHWIDHLGPDGFPIHPVRLPHRMSARDALQGSRDLHQLMRRLDVDLVHTHNAHHGVIGRILARARGIPAVHTWRYNPADATENPVARVIYQAAESLASRAGRAVYFQNGEDLGYAVRRRIVPKRRALLVGNGIDVDRYAAGLPDRDVVRESLGVDPDAEVVLCIARLAERKGLPDVIAAMAALASQRDRLELVLLGTGPDRASLERQVAEAGIAHRVHFGGQRDDIPDVLRVVDVLCLASRREGVPRSVMEAMAARCPVAGTDVVGTREVVKHEETGLLVPYQAPLELATAIARLLDDGALRERVVDNAFAQVKANWDQAAVVAQVAASYQQILSRPSRRRS